MSVFIWFASIYIKIGDLASFDACEQCGWYLAWKHSTITTLYWKQLFPGISFSNIFVPGMGIVFSGMMDMHWFSELFWGLWVVFWHFLSQGVGDAWRQMNHRTGDVAIKASSFSQRIICSPKSPQSNWAFQSQEQLSALLQKEKQAWWGW